MAICHRPTDRPPLGEVCIDRELVKTCLGCSEVGFAELHQFICILGLDLICLPPPSLPIQGPAAEPHNWDGPLWEDLERWNTESRAYIFAMLNGGCHLGTATMGFKDFMLAVARVNATTKEVFDRATRMNVTMARHAVDRGAHAIVLADDIAHVNGLFVAPSFLTSTYFPSLHPLLEAMNVLGVPVFFHSDGDLREVLPDIVSAGFAGLHCLDESAGMNLAEIKREYGERLCLWGNLPPLHLLESRERHEIEREVNRVLTIGTVEGGFIFGTSSGLFRGMRYENLRWAFGAATEFSPMNPDSQSHE